MGVAPTGQTAIMNRLMMYGFPLFVVIGGPFFPLAILFYWLSNNSWTFGQLWVAHRIQDRKRAVEAKVVEAAKVETTYTKPAPEPGRRTPSGRSFSPRRSTGPTPLQGTARRRTPRPATALARPVRRDPEVPTVRTVPM